MELSQNTVFGKCRCCKAQGYHSDLTREHNTEEGRVVYSDIFIECFNLLLCTDIRLTTLICRSCIKQLKDAYTFKKNVVDIENELLKALSGPNGSEAVFVDGDATKHIKQEEVQVIKKELNIELEYGAEDDECLASLKKDSETNEGKPIEKQLKKRTTQLKRKSETSKEDLKRDPVEITSNKKKRIQQTKNKDKNTDKNIDKAIDVDKEKNPYTVERLTHGANITALLEFSNVTAFKSKFQRAYPCFYCEKLFEFFEELKGHQKVDHNKDSIGECVFQKYKNGKPDTLVVYADVTDLKCTICNNDIPSLKDLKTHLTDVHKKKMYLDVSDRVIPFKVIENNFKCQICENVYETFGAIERHMNTHYRNYVCAECDAGFVTKQRLSIHGARMHSKKSNEYPCEICQKQFATQQKKKTHVETVHENIKKYKCNRCPERFNEYFRRHKHMVLVHGVAPLEYKCNVCEKSFDRRYTLSTHMRTHIQQKDVQCEVCPYRCFTKAELRHHMIKHNGERIHECSVCKKSYAREKTLKEHMRIHTNDRRYVCPVCGQAFIQNCSLKSHIKSHKK